jgi:hypothetical protein
MGLFTTLRLKGPHHRGYHHRAWSNHTVEVQTVVELFGSVHGILTRHGVNHKQNLGGINGFLMAAISSIICSSMAKRPAVSTITKS